MKPIDAGLISLSVLIVGYEMTNTEKDNVLLPCPFCGGEAEVLWCHNDVAAYVQCTECTTKTDTYNTRAFAADRWNTRNEWDGAAQHTRPGDAVEALKNAMDRGRYSFSVGAAAEVMVHLSRQGWQLTRKPEV